MLVRFKRHASGQVAHSNHYFYILAANKIFVC